MYIQPARPSEADRLASLNALQVMDTPRESRFDRLVFILAQMARAPMAGMGLIDYDRQWFKGRVGIQAPHFPREHSMCAHAIQSAGPMVVEDTTADPRFQDNPLVVGAPFMRFYAGAPLLSPGGYRVGTMCVFDRVPRTLSAAQFRVLEQVAADASALLTARIVEDGTAPSWLGYTGDV